MTHQIPKKIWSLLALMTALSFGGPFGIWAVIRGGQNPEWPPDRPIEWVVLVAVTALVIALLATCLATAIRLKKTLSPAQQAKNLD